MSDKKTDCRSCKYYEYDVDSPWPVCKLHRFHFEHDYTPCSDYVSSSSGSSSGGCYITTAVCNSFGKPDDCYELTLFRGFRDGYLAGTENGENLIAEYYRTAPEIVKTIDMLPERDEVYSKIWQQYLSKCLEYIQDKELEACKALYIKMMRCLERLYL